MKKLLLALTLVGMVSCASTPGPVVKKDIQNSFVVKKSFDDTWAKLVSFSSTHGMNIKTIDKSSGLMAFEHAMDDGFYAEYMDCPGGKSLFNVPYYGPVTLNFTVEKQSADVSKLTINIFGGVSFNNSLNARDACYSNGEFEREVYCAVSGETCAPKPKPTPMPTPKGAVQY